MRKLLRSFKRNLSLLLVIALLFGCLPSNTLAVSAQEAEQTKVQEEIEEEAVVQENEAQSEQQVEDEELLEEEETQVEQQAEEEELLEEEKTEVEQQEESKELLQEEEQQTGNEEQQKENYGIVQEKEPEIEVLEEEGLSYLVTKPAEGPEFTFSYVECKDQYGRTYYLQNVPISVTMKDSKAPVITAETVTLKTNDFEAKELVFKKGEKEIDIFDIVSLDSRFEVVQLHEGMPPTIKPVDPYSIEPGTYEVTVWVTDMDTGVGYLYHHNKDRSNLDTIGTKVTIKVTVVEESE